MKITLCGSITFIDEMEATRKQLEALGHAVKLPPSELLDERTGRMISAKEYYAIRKVATADDDWVWQKKALAMQSHFDKVVWSDAILVCNHTKNDIVGYIGANTLLEMGLAFHLNKLIYLLNPVPELAYSEEIRGMRPVVLAGQCENIGLGKEGPFFIAQK
jgi:hypothetical protein